MNGETCWHPKTAVFGDYNCLDGKSRMVMRRCRLCGMMQAGFLGPAKDHSWTELESSPWSEPEELWFPDHFEGDGEERADPITGASPELREMLEQPSPAPEKPTEIIRFTVPLQEQTEPMRRALGLATRRIEALETELARERHDSAAAHGLLEAMTNEVERLKKERDEVYAQECQTKELLDAMTRDYERLNVDHQARRGELVAAEQERDKARARVEALELEHAR